MKPQIQGLLIGLAGAAAGGILGCVLFLLIARHGFYALMLPGGLAGIGGAIFVKTRSIPRGVLCGIVALVSGIISEWKFAPFIKDAGLGYFLTHLQDLSPVTLLMIVGGGVFGYWFSLGREKATTLETPTPPV